MSVVVPAHNEQGPLATLLPILRGMGLSRIIVVDNASTDRTADVVRASGCDLVHQPRRGYGAACATGIGAVPDDCDVVVFLDADMSDDPTRLPELVEPVLFNRADLVIGCRDRELRRPGSMTAAQRFGTWLATRLIRLGWGYAYRDLGPFRAVRRSSLLAMNMRDRAFGWTVEMQIRALQMGLRVEQMTVPYRRRHNGKSKISGTVRGVLLAGYYILTTIARLYFARRV